MNVDTDGLLVVAGGGAAGAAVLFKLYGMLRAETGTSKVIKSLTDELTRKDEQLAAKEKTIKRLVEEKADLMTQLAEIPRLRDEIFQLEEQIRGLAGLFNHLISNSAIQLTPEHQINLLRMMTPRQPEGNGR